jgi:hypothetical protein
MAQFVHFQHKRFRVNRNTSTVGFECNVRPKKQMKVRTLFGGIGEQTKDSVIIRLSDGDKIASLSLEDSEIEALIHELKRLKT